jgi:hypothetical protein
MGLPLILRAKAGRRSEPSPLKGEEMTRLWVGTVPELVLCVFDCICLDS